MRILDISIMCHYRALTGDFRDGDFSAPAVAEAIRNLCDADLLQPRMPTERDPARLEITSRGIAYTDGLKAVPLPVLRWALPVSEAS